MTRITYATALLLLACGAEEDAEDCADRLAEIQLACADHAVEVAGCVDGELFQAAHDLCAGCRVQVESIAGGNGTEVRATFADDGQLAVSYDTRGVAVGIYGSPTTRDLFGAEVGTCDTPPSADSRATEADRILRFDLRGAQPFPFCPPVEPGDALRGCVNLSATPPASPEGG